MNLQVCLIPALSDNYIFLLRCQQTNITAVVDPGDAKPVLNWLQQRDWQLDMVLNTHHHSDHVGANLILKEKTGCKVIGAEKDKHRIPGIDQTVKQGDQILVGHHQSTILEVPGHTSGHIAYWFAADNGLFCGDTLFSLGCGRLFEGTAEQMWQSMLKIRQLPADTKIYCAHEYTQANAAFALYLEPANQQLRDVYTSICDKRTQDVATIPSNLGFECQFNPFLRVDQDDFQTALGLKDSSPEKVFAQIRYQKDNFVS
ncbi:MAG: hydroxyacylglutathione hydrolase [Gammaproteobacteria bacterium]|nr:hydroxyacylglutathione hydrolase [Gammaproteobacteria bacterium]